MFPCIGAQLLGTTLTMAVPVNVRIVGGLHHKECEMFLPHVCSIIENVRCFTRIGPHPLGKTLTRAVPVTIRIVGGLHHRECEMFHPHWATLPRCNTY